MSKFIDGSAEEEEDGEECISEEEMDDELDIADESDLAFICDEEDDQPPQKKKKESPKKNKIILDDDDEKLFEPIDDTSKDTVVSNEDKTHCQSELDDVISLKSDIAKKTKPKSTSILGNDVVKEALTLGNSAPVIVGKNTSTKKSKQSNQKTVGEDLITLIKDINNKKEHYDNDRKSVVIKFAKYLQRFKTEEL